VWPIDSEVILKRFNATTLDKDKNIELRELGDRDTWRDIRKILDAIVAERAKDEGKRVAAALHSLQV
jgi:hypothetical protein